MGDQKLCYGCFEPLSDDIKCPHCGYKQKSPYSPSYIAPGTMLNDRYMVGKLLSHNGEGASYIAFDTVISNKVIIKEYMPDSLCSRDKESSRIIVNQGSNVQYKSLMEEFLELNKKLAKLRSVGNINPVLDLFQANNTSYVVFEYIDGNNLIQYLKKNGGELSWESVMKMFPPLFTSLSQIHNAGIVHRGISPQTIYVTSKGELKLTDFCIAAVRTTKTELNAEIFKGYAAPEQYSPSSWQGTWTDVYGISSVLYRILTGCMPTESTLRNEADDLTPPSSLNSEIPDNVSDAIMDGMKISGDERIQTVTELVLLIFQRSDDDKTKTTLNIGNIASRNVREAQAKHRTVAETQYEDEEPKSERVYYKTPVRREPEYEEAELTVIDRIKFPVFIGILVIGVIVFLVMFINKLNIIGSGGNNLSASLPVLTTPPVTTTVTTIPPDDEDNGFYLTNIPPATLAAATTTTAPDTDESEDPDETTSAVTTIGEANIQMINLVGKNYNDFVSTLDINIIPEYVSSDDKPKGEILSQSVAEGTWISSGTEVTVTVSRGSGGGIVPPYMKTAVNCTPLDEYLAMLQEEGIEYKAVPDYRPELNPGYVIRTDTPPGSEVDGILTVTYTSKTGNDQTIYSAGASDAQ